MRDNSFSKEFLTELKKGNKKSLGKAIGLPDAEDEAFLKRLIDRYERSNPGWLTFMRNEARRQFEAGSKGSVRNEEALISKDSNMTYDFELPVTFYKLIEKFYPLMFRSPEQYHWFKKTFTALMIRPNTKRRPR